MSHHHHDHHSHTHETIAEMSFDKKMVKLLEHWIKHNTDHAGTYKEWAKKAKENNMEKAAIFLNEAADKTLEINTIFDKALILLSK
jgi:hypothetical protein